MQKIVYLFKAISQRRIKIGSDDGALSGGHN